jgi:hypothetical protein
MKIKYPAFAFAREMSILTLSQKTSGRTIKLGGETI